MRLPAFSSASTLSVLRDRPALSSEATPGVCATSTTATTATTDNAALIPTKGRVAVIGAGAAGLQSGRQLTMHGYETLIFDQSNHVGGLWETRTVANVSPIYNSLRTNLVKYVMVYEDDQYPPSVPQTFLSHQQVNAYLQGYALKHDLHRLIKFRHAVTDVRKHANGKWTVTTVPNRVGLEEEAVDLTEEETIWQGFDAVFICTGHFSKPRMWGDDDDDQVPGYEYLEENDVIVEHSMLYRSPDEKRYRGKRVVVIGAGPSGVDIGLELSSVASFVYMSHSLPRTVFGDHLAKRPKNIKEVGRIQRVRDDGSLELSDNELLDRVDVIVTCTGYRRDYGFLKSDAVSFSDDGRNVFGLLKHCVCMKDPTLVFIGVPNRIIPMPTFEQQVAFAIAVLHRRVVNAEVFGRLVKAEEERVQKWTNWKQFHLLGASQWEYICDLARITGFKKVAPALIEVSQFCSRVRKKDPLNYRQMEVTMHGCESGMWSVSNVMCQQDMSYGKEVDESIPLIQRN